MKTNMYVAKRGEVVAMRKQISYLQKETNRNFEKYPKQPKKYIKQWQRQCEENFG